MMLWNLPAFVPAADVTLSESDMLLALDVPGLTQDDLSIDLVDGHLVVRGERRLPETFSGSQMTHRERRYGSFERRIRVPEGVEPDSITASLDNGVLSLIVPKPERMKPRSIAIGTGDAGRVLQTAGD